MHRKTHCNADFLNKHNALSFVKYIKQNLDLIQQPLYSVPLNKCLLFISYININELN